MIRFLMISILCVVAAIGATFWRYQSLHPCDWLQKDMVEASGQPDFWVEIRIKARFLLDGITEPSLENCLNGWWTYRIEEIEKLEVVE